MTGKKQKELKEMYQTYCFWMSFHNWKPKPYRKWLKEVISYGTNNSKDIKKD